jgi:hypothetical protein
MFGRYIKRQEGMSEIMRLFPDHDAMYPFEWSSSTLLQAAAEKLESDERGAAHHDPEAFERPVTSLKAKCVMPNGFVAIISAPDMDRTTFQILHHGTVALHLEVCFKHEREEQYYDDWRLGVMTFNYDAECNTLSMWSPHGPNHYYSRDDMFALYNGKEVEVQYEKHRNDRDDFDLLLEVFDTIWPVFKLVKGTDTDWAILDLERIRVQVDMIQAPRRRMPVAMGLHHRLGKNSWLYQLEPEIVHRITELAERESLSKHAMYRLEQMEYAFE